MTDTQKVAINAWCKWYADRMDNLIQLSVEELVGDDYSGYEADLFEAFGCTSEPFPEAKK